MAIDFSAGLGETQPDQTEQVAENETEALHAELKSATPAPVDPMDPKPLLNLFSKFRTEIDKMANKAQGYAVTDDESSAQATEMAAQAKKLSQVIQKKRKEVKEPYLKMCQELDGGVKPLVDHLSKIVHHCESLNTPYLVEKRRLQREEDERLRREAAEAEKRRVELAKKAEEAGAPPPIEKAPIVAPVVKPLKSETATGKQALKEVPQWNITDWPALIAAALPTRQAKIEEAITPYINAQIKAGNHHIPGVEWSMVPKVQTRTRRSGGSW